MRLRPILLLCILASSAPLAADTTLSVVPLAKALQNSGLASDSPEEAQAAVAKLLLNHPEGEEETRAHHAKLAALAEHKDTRVGKLFFRCLETMPDVKQVPDTAREVDILVRRPLALEAVARVRVSWGRDGDTWKVSRLNVYLEGPGAAPVVKAPPYFADGAVPGEWLDLEALDYLVGRDPTQRNRVEKDPFDYEAGLERYLKGEPDAYETLITRLKKEVTPRTDRAERIMLLKPHLSREAQEALEQADGDDSRRKEFWDALFKDLEAVATSAQPSSVPVRRGSEVSITVKDADGKTLSESVTQRLQSGEIAPRVRVEERNDGAKGN